MGLGAPRESMHLVKKGQDARLLTTKTRKDYTSPMRKYAEEKIKILRSLDLDGYVFKKFSPSCGMEKVRVFGKNGIPAQTGTGIYAQVLMRSITNLPVGEEGNPILRENWVEKVFAYRRVKDLWKNGWTVRKVVDFHSANKFMLLAHSETLFRRLGRLVASAKKIPKEEFRLQYENQFMAALKIVATRKKNTINAALNAIPLLIHFPGGCPELSKSFLEVSQCLGFSHKSVGGCLLPQVNKEDVAIPVFEAIPLTLF